MCQARVRMAVRNRPTTMQDGSEGVRREKGRMFRCGPGSDRHLCRFVGADAGSRRTFYMRLLSDFERFPAFHLTLVSLSNICFMSSKRGRKRNDNLPPNRARDVQRAFRARRAAHLQVSSLVLFFGRSVANRCTLGRVQELEQRVMELEEENNALRIALNLPPASRPSLGKGPTGKDRPRALEGSSRSYPSSAKSRESSNADLDSPPSTRTNSLSPSAMTSVRPSPRTAPTLESGGAWDQSLLMGEQHATDGQGGSTTYPLPSSASITHKGVHQYSFSDPMPPNNRGSMGSGIYMGSQQSHYSPTHDRPMASTYGSAGYIARDSRDEQQYPYSQPQYPNHDSGMQSHSPTTSTAHHSQIHHPRESLPAQSNVSYSQRRSNTEPHPFRAILSQPHPHVSHPMQLNNSIRLPSPHDNGPPSQRPSPHYGGVEGRLNSIP
jgi:hypothetical protein